jgi:hypothetical protein
MSTDYFSCSGGPSAVFIKSTPGHNALNLCFSIRRDLWVTQCVLVHLGCETSAYYFVIHSWKWYRFHIKRIGTHYDELVFLHPVGAAN